jgi:heme-degrading monooxygenase HmoA
VIVSIVRFRSLLSDGEVRSLYERRSARYEKVPGLIEKLYLRFRSGEHGAVYVWEDEDALRAFRASELGRSIGSAYAVEGEPSIELADVALVVENREVGAR